MNLQLLALSYPRGVQQGYQRRQPESTLLYRCIQGHWRTWQADLALADPDTNLPAFVRTEFEAFLRCGILGHGFVRVRCSAVAFAGTQWRAIRNRRTIQRFDSALALALNVHFHALILDGAYGRNVDGSARFRPVAAPDDEDVAEVACVFTDVALKLFYSESDEFGAREPGMAAIAAASLSKMVATGGRRGLPVRRLKAGERPTSRLMCNRCAEVQGFNIHANVRVAGNDRQGLETLCRYVGRPPLSDARLRKPFLATQTRVV